jgi:general secretion pathway protein A
MYLHHFKLHDMPFQISPDPRFLWLGEQHKEALAVLKYGVLNNQGFLLLTGDVGTGKTTLINALVNSLGPDTLFVNVVDPRLDKLDFFKFVARSFGLETEFTTKFDFLMAFKNFLHRAHDSKKNVLLIIDEAQKLSLDSLEEIRLLSNIERQETKLLNVFFIGQDEFNDTLIRPECRALRQRITIVHNIKALNEKETAQYVKYRLSVAGTQRQIFTDRALKKIYAFSGGYPRLINIICDRALLAGYSEDIQTIDHKIIRECTGDVSLPGEIWQQRAREVTQGTRTSLRRAKRAAIFAGFMLILILSGFVFTSKFLGDHGANLRKFYGTLFSATGQDLPERPSGKTEKQIANPSYPPAPLPSQSSSEADPGRVPKSPGQKKGTLVLGGPPALETSEQGNLFRDSKLVIPFGYDTNELPPEILTRLDELAGYMLQKTDFDIAIRGYTDALGSSEYNRSLSTFRANVVKSYLAGKGINPNRMRVIGMGNAAPRMANKTPEGRAANRRVEIELVAHKP